MFSHSVAGWESVDIQYDLSYIDGTATVDDVHPDVARVAVAPGHLRFMDGVHLDGTVTLEFLGRELGFKGVQRPEHASDPYAPSSAKRQGGAPSSFRARLARKHLKGGITLRELLQFFQALWPTESGQLAEFNKASSRNARRLEKLLNNLVVRHGSVRILHSQHWHPMGWSA